MPLPALSKKGNNVFPKQIQPDIYYMQPLCLSQENFYSDNMSKMNSILKKLFSISYF